MSEYAQFVAKKLHTVAPSGIRDTGLVRAGSRMNLSASPFYQISEGGALL